MIKEKFEQVKEHIKENKSAYISGGVCLVIGAVGGYTLFKNKEAAQFVQKIVQVGVGNRANATIINFVERSTPSRPVHLVGTDLYFPSLSEAARQTGHNVSMISKNVNGYLDSLNGDVFEAIDIA